jgi:hypothetical protein
MKNIEKLSEWEQETIKKVYKAILNGKVYAKVNKVSSSGMTRHIAFYMILNGGIQNITTFIGWLNGYLKAGEYEKGEGLKVGGCGMDMVFHTLYNCVEMKDQKKWKGQRYNTL